MWTFSTTSTDWPLCTGKAAFSKPFARPEAVHFLDALSFLSRLGSARVLPHGIGPCLWWFPAVGLVLGALCSMCACLLLSVLQTEDATALAALLAAWGWLVLLLWLSRALHWDGLADLADACGSGASGERFWQILRDSRLGAFGALALVSVFLGQWLCLSWHITHGQWLILVLTPAWGRACAVWLAARVTAREINSLGGMAAQAASGPARLYRWLAVSTGCVMLVMGYPVWQLLALLLGYHCIQAYLSRMAQEQGGISGDFLGAAVESGQLWFLLALV